MSSDQRADLQQPLLQPATDEEGARPKAQAVWLPELRDLLHLAAPACLQLCAQQGLVVVSQALVGHIGPDELAAASIGITWFNLMFYLLLGLASALDTLGAQAFGAGDSFAVLVWGWAAAISLSVMCCFMGAALWVADLVAIHLFRQPEHIAAMVGLYCRWMIPSLWPFVYAIVLMKVLQAQNRMWVPANVTAVVCVANAGITWGLIQVGGFTGAAIANTASRVLLFLIMLGYGAIWGFVQPPKQTHLGEEEASAASTKAVEPGKEQPGALQGFTAACRTQLLLRFL